VDMLGVVNFSMDGSAPGKPDQRLITAIIDHPNGPHFAKFTGGIATMEKWQDAIDRCLKSATVR